MSWLCLSVYTTSTLHWLLLVVGTQHTATDWSRQAPCAGVTRAPRTLTTAVPLPYPYLQVNAAPSSSACTARYYCLDLISLVIQHVYMNPNICPTVRYVYLWCPSILLLVLEEHLGYAYLVQSRGIQMPMLDTLMLYECESKLQSMVLCMYCMPLVH